MYCGIISTDLLYKHPQNKSNGLLDMGGAFGKRETRSYDVGLNAPILFIVPDFKTD